MSTIAASVALATRKLATEPSVYPTSPNDENIPTLATLQLSPINEMDSGSVNNTLNTNSPTTAELARSVLPTVTSSSGFAEITNTPSMMRVTLFPKVANGTSPSHEVSVSIQGMPLISPSPSASNVIITEIPSDSIIDDEVDAIKGRPLSRQSSSLSAAPYVGRARTISDSSNKSPVPGRDNLLGNLSAPSTLKKTNPEQKTGEVYV